MAYYSTKDRRRTLSFSHLIARGDSLLGHAALVLSLLFIAALIVGL